MYTKVSLLGMFSATAIAVPVSAQEFYVGASLGSLNADHYFETTGALAATTSGNQRTIFAGVDISFGGNWFGGAEIQHKSAGGYSGTGGSSPFVDDVSTRVVRGQLGYDFSNFRVYGFVGAGRSEFTEPGDQTYNLSSTIVGIGAEVDVAEKVAIRIEAEMNELSNIDTCCVYTGFDPSTARIENKSLSVGALYRF